MATIPNAAFAQAVKRSGVMYPCASVEVAGASNKYGRIVKEYLQTYDAASDAQVPNDSVLKLAYDNRKAFRDTLSSGSMAVKFHMDYNRVLEDALYGEVMRVATKVMYFAGEGKVIVNNGNLVSTLGSAAAPVKAGAMFKIVPDAGIALQDEKKVVAFTIRHGLAGAISTAATAFVNTDDYVVVTDTFGLTVFENRDSAVTSSNLQELHVSPTLDVAGRDLFTLSIGANIARQAALEDETARAEAAEGTLTTNLSGEIARAIAAEGTLTTNLSAEATRAQGVEASLASELAAEIARAEGVEGVLRSDLDAEIANARNAEQTLEIAINDEVNRANLAEQTISAALQQEQERALGVESNLLSELNSEIVRALAAEETLQTNISNENGRARSVEDGITSQLEAEKSRAQDAENALQSSLFSEIARVDAADLLLTTNLDAEIARATEAEGLLRSNLAFEESRAIAAEGVLQSGLDTEIARAQNAEGVLTTNLAFEKSRATAAELDLTNNLATEVSDRAAADVVLTTNLAFEVSRALAAEGVLRSDLADEVSRATAAESSEAAQRAAADAALAVYDSKLKLRIDYMAACLDKSMKTAVERFRLLENFMYTAEQFMDMSSDGSNTYQFSTSVDPYTSAASDPQFGLGADAELPASLPASAGLDFLSMVKTLTIIELPDATKNSAKVSQTVNGLIKVNKGASIQPDESAPASDPLGRVGWYFSRTAASGTSKINWYYFRNYTATEYDATTGATVTILESVATNPNVKWSTFGAANSTGFAYVLLTIDGSIPVSKSDLFLTLYTFPRGDFATGTWNGTRDFRSWYRSTRNFLADTASGKIPAGSQVLLTRGSVPLDIFPHAERVSMVMLNEASPKGNLYGDEVISQFAISTNSAAAPMSFVVHAAGFVGGTDAANSKQQISFIA